jgi:hypothetical protein
MQPLPADRAYVLVAPPRSGTGASGARSPAAESVTSTDLRWEPLRNALARDILRAHAPQGTDGWWLTASASASCGITEASHTPAGITSSSSSRPRRLIFAEADPLAMALAQRLAVLAASDAPRSPESDAARSLLPELAAPVGERLIASGVSDADLEAGLRAGTDAAYLIALPRRVLDPCAHLRVLAATVPWVRPAHVAFIVESAATLITNAGAPALTIDWLGTVRVVQHADGTSRQR